MPEAIQTFNMFFIVHAFRLPVAEALTEPMKLDAESDKHCGWSRLMLGWPEEGRRREQYFGWRWRRRVAALR